MPRGKQSSILGAWTVCRDTGNRCFSLMLHFCLFYLFIFFLINTALIIPIMPTQNYFPLYITSGNVRPAGRILTQLTCAHSRPVVNVGGFTERTVRSTDVMVVTADHHWTLQQRFKVDSCQMIICPSKDVTLSTALSPNINSITVLLKNHSKV